MPRKNRSAPVQIHNLGSREGARLDFGREELWERLTAPLTALAARLPVYLVSEAQMDHLFPPERRRFFREEKLRERLQEVRAQEREREDGEDDPFAPFQGLDVDDADPDTWGRVSVVVAAGLYVRRLDPGSKGAVPGLAAWGPAPGALAAFAGEEGPAIFLCPERILAWAQDVRVPEDLALDKVYCHELGHAYMDTADFHPDPYGRPWGRVVEESLANLVAFQCFQGAEALWVARMIRKQPPEYRGYAAVATHPVLFHIDLPFRRHPVFREDYLYWLHRYDLPGRLLTLLLFPSPLDVGNLNLQAWQKTKQLGLWQHPEAEWAWKAFARLLLEEAVRA
jgi:hypothetical protein